MSDNEPNLIKEFRGLYDYVRLMGEHINQVYSRLDRIEKNINEISASQRRFAEESIAEITNIKNNMVSKNEFNNFMERLKGSMGETLPPLPNMNGEANAEKATQEANEHQTTT